MKSPTSDRPDTVRTLVPHKTREGWWQLYEGSVTGERFGHYTSMRKARGALIAYNAKNNITQNIEELFEAENKRHKQIMEL